MDRRFFVLGCTLAFVAVALGALGSHALRTRLDARSLEVWDIAVRYHSLHALALLAVGWAAARWRSRAIFAGGWLFLAGIALFSGSLYALALTGARWLGPVTPLGGVLFLLGWLCLAAGAVRGRQREDDVPR